MKSGYIALPDTHFDLTNKSGIYNLYEHYQNKNNIALKNYPITSIFDDFIDNNLYKYPYKFTDNISIVNINNAVYGVGITVDSISDGYLQFDLYPKQDSKLSFYLYLPPVLGLTTEDLAAYYELYINNIKHTLLSDQTNNIQLLNTNNFYKYTTSSYLYTNINTYYYTIKITFKHNGFFNTLITNISFPSS